MSMFYSSHNRTWSYTNCIVTILLHSQDCCTKKAWKTFLDVIFIDCEHKDSASVLRRRQVSDGTVSKTDWKVKVELFLGSKLAPSLVTAAHHYYFSWWISLHFIVWIGASYCKLQQFQYIYFFCERAANESIFNNALLINKVKVWKVSVELSFDFLPFPPIFDNYREFETGTFSLCLIRNIQSYRKRRRVNIIIYTSSTVHIHKCFSRLAIKWAILVCRSFKCRFIFKNSPYTAPHFNPSTVINVVQRCGCFSCQRLKNWCWVFTVNEWQLGSPMAYISYARISLSSNIEIKLVYSPLGDWACFQHKSAHRHPIRGESSQTYLLIVLKDLIFKCISSWTKQNFFSAVYRLNRQLSCHDDANDFQQQLQLPFLFI